MIQFSHVYRIYRGDHAALRDVNMSVAAGEWLYIVGPSGSGKSTFLRLASILDQPTSGKIFFMDKETSSCNKQEKIELRRSMGFVFQDYRLIPEWTVFENIALPLQIRNYSKLEIQRKVDGLLNDVGLYQRKNDFPTALSGGEQQRVAAARAIVHEPKIIFADEPTGNLDAGWASLMMELLLQQKKKGVAVLMATHDLQLLNKHPARVLQLEGGRCLSA